MVAIAIEFSTGRYHANPWGRHVNEGVVEWPPSPYRLARAVVDCVYRRRPDWPEDRIRAVLRSISGMPLFSLPLSTAAHLRTYQSSNKKIATEKQIIFDSFVAVDPGEKVFISCPPDTDSTTVTDLESILGEINYLGRSESWVTITLVKDSNTIEWNCRPIEGTSGGTVVKTACLMKDFSENPPAKFKNPDWLQAICLNTRELNRGGFSQPPALKWVYYSLPEWALQPPPPVPRRRANQQIRCARFAVTSKVLPGIKETLPLAERIRAYLMGIHRRIMNDDPTMVSPLFSGKTAAGKPLEGHQHATIVPRDEDGDGRIDHVTITVGRDFDRTEIAAIDRLWKIWQPGGRPDIDVVLLSLSASPPLETAIRWVSATPFVTARHHRPGRGTWWDWLTGEIRHECVFRGLPEPATVEWIPAVTAGRPIRWLEFVSSRKGRSPMRAHGCILTFPNPVHGPFSLGSLSHFGLGCFVPFPEESPEP